LAIQSTNNNGSSIDVANIVSQLMQVEKKPLVAIEERISKTDVKISSLGAFQARLSEFKVNLEKLQDPAQSVKRKISSSASNSASAQLDINGLPSLGRYKLSVEQVAESTLVNIDGFSSDTQIINNATEYRIKVGNVTYQPTEALTLAGLRDWINSKPGLNTSVKATLVQQDAGHWVMSIQGLATGSENAVQVFKPGNGTAVVPYQSAQDAEFSINGISFSAAITRSMM